MSIDNKQFIKKSQELLKEMGIEVKTTQLYELFSKLAGEKNWNIAKSKNLEFSNTIYEQSPLSVLVENIQHLDPQLVLKEIHKRQGFKQELLDTKSTGLSSLVQWEREKTEDKSQPEIISVLTMVITRPFFLNKTLNFSAKDIHHLRKSMEIKKATHGILYTTSEDIPAAFYKMAVEYGVEIVDFNDLKRISYQIKD